MFGAKTRRIHELTTLLDTTTRRLYRVRDDLETAQYNQRTAINARETAENITAEQRTELVAHRATIRRLNNLLREHTGADTDPAGAAIGETDPLVRENQRLKTHAAALEKRLAQLQAASERDYADLAARAGTASTVEDDEADTAALIGGAR